MQSQNKYNFMCFQGLYLILLGTILDIDSQQATD